MFTDGVTSSPAFRRSFQKGLDTDKSRRQRQDERLDLRRQVRREQMKKRRRALTAAASEAQSDAQSCRTRGEAPEGRTPEQAPRTKESSSSDQPFRLDLESLKDEDRERDDKGVSAVPRFVVPSLAEQRKLLLQCQQQLLSPKASDHFRGACMLRKLLSVERDPPFARVVRSGILQRVVYHMQNFRRPDLQREATWILSTVASGPTEITKEVCRNGGIAALQKVLLHYGQMVRNPDALADEEALQASLVLVDNALYGLGNICGDDRRLRDLVFRSEVYEWLVDNVLTPTLSMSVREGLVWNLGSIARGFHPDSARPRLARMIRPLVQLYKSHAESNRGIPSEAREMIVDLLWALDYLASLPDGNGDCDMVQAILDTGVLQVLVRHLKAHPGDAQVVGPIVRILGEISSGTDAQTDALLRSGYVPILAALLETRVTDLRKDACWTLSNISAGTVPQKRMLLRADKLVENLFAVARHDLRRVRQEAVFCVCNFLNESPDDVVTDFLRHDAIEVLVDPLSWDEELPNSLIMSIVEALTQVCLLRESAPNDLTFRIEQAGGLDALEQLQGKDFVHDDTYEMIATFIRSFFGEDTGEDSENDARDERLVTRSPHGGVDSYLSAQTQRMRIAGDPECKQLEFDARATPMKLSFGADETFRF